MTSPRILLVIADHWLRVALRAELIDRGYDAVGATDIRMALRSRPLEPGRDVVRAILVDQEALSGVDARDIERLAARHPCARVLLLGSRVVAPVSGPWHTIVRRPIRIDEVVAALARAMEG